jgi:hypothetical protein
VAGPVPHGAWTPLPRIQPQPDLLTLNEAAKITTAVHQWTTSTSSQQPCAHSSLVHAPVRCGPSLAITHGVTPALRPVAVRKLDFMRLPRRTTVLTAILGSALIVPAAVAAHRGGDRHVLLLSVDGLHQADLTRYIGTHPRSALAALVHRGVDFTHASTPVPSDSFPGMIAQVTGGNPGNTGVYYDSSFTPEINSQADGLPTGQDWTKDNAKTQQYDGCKTPGRPQ